MVEDKTPQFLGLHWRLEPLTKKKPTRRLIDIFLLFRIIGRLLIVLMAYFYE